MDADRLDVTAPGLPGRHGTGQPARLAQSSDEAGVGQGKGPAVGHDVDDTGLLFALRGAQTGEHGGQARVQVGHHHRHLLQVEVADRQGQQAVVSGSLFVDAGDHDLVGHIAGLDEVALMRRVGGENVWAGTDHGVPAGAQGTVEG